MGIDQSKVENLRVNLGNLFKRLKSMTETTGHKRLILGSASWASLYGKFNHDTMTPGALANLLAQAESLGINEIDTAPTYGDAESLLGQTKSGEIHVYSKVSQFDWATSKESALKSVETTLKRTGVHQLEGIMFHSSKSLIDSPGAALDFMNLLVESGRAKKWGVSVYTPNEVNIVMDLCNPDFIQAPISVADRRLEKSGLLGELRKRNIDVHARSIFLQGFLLQDPNSMPEKLSKFAAWLSKFEEISKNQGLTKLQMALLFIIGEPSYSRAVVGVNSVDNLLEVAAAATENTPIPDFNELPEIIDEKILDPRAWKL